MRRGGSSAPQPPTRDVPLYLIGRGDSPLGMAQPFSEGLMSLLLVQDFLASHSAHEKYRIILISCMSLEPPRVLDEAQITTLAIEENVSASSSSILDL